MVGFEAVQEANARFTAEHHEGLVCVFEGGTSGSGSGTLERMATMVQSSTFYVIGRSKERFAGQQAKLEALNSRLKIVFLVGEVSLISHVDRICEQITAAEKKIDLLYMSAGCIPLNGAEFTTEGLERCFSLSYYSRIRFVVNLLPLLRQAPRSRVLDLLNAGREQKLFEDDLGLEKNWAARPVINHTTTMTSLALEYLAKDDANRNIVFMHVFPGLVQTDNFSRLKASESSGILWRFSLPLLQRIVGMLQYFLGTSIEACGERQAYHLTSDKYSRPGAVRVNDYSDVVTSAGVLERYRQDGWYEKVWDHTLRVWEKAQGENAHAI